MSVTAAEKRMLASLLVKVARRKRKNEIREEISFDSEDEADDLKFSQGIVGDAVMGLTLQNFRDAYPGGGGSGRKAASRLLRQIQSQSQAAGGGGEASQASEPKKEKNEKKKKVKKDKKDKTDKKTM